MPSVRDSAAGRDGGSLQVDTDMAPTSWRMMI
jgi:hypothetical protein